MFKCYASLQQQSTTLFSLIPDHLETGLADRMNLAQRIDAYGNEKVSGSVRHKFWDGYQWNPSGLQLEPLGSQPASPTAAISSQ